MKTINQNLILLFSIIFFYSCGNNSSSSSKSKCDDMRSYNKGVEMAENDKRASSVTGVRYSCNEVYAIAPGSYDKSCFCKGFNSVY